MVFSKCFIYDVVCSIFVIKLFFRRYKDKRKEIPVLNSPDELTNDCYGDPDSSLRISSVVFAVHAPNC